MAPLGAKGRGPRDTTDSHDATIRMRLPVRELRGHFELRDDVMTIRGTLGDRPIVLELRSFE